jgi:hypothetical protein
VNKESERLIREAAQALDAEVMVCIAKHFSAPMKSERVIRLIIAAVLAIMEEEQDGTR